MNEKQAKGDMWHAHVTSNPLGASAQGVLGQGGGYCRRGEEEKGGFLEIDVVPVPSTLLGESAAAIWGRKMMSDANFRGFENKP